MVVLNVFSDIADLPLLRSLFSCLHYVENINFLDQMIKAGR